MTKPTPSLDTQPHPWRMFAMVSIGAFALAIASGFAF
jgi:hypothetical protein